MDVSKNYLTSKMLKTEDLPTLYGIRNALNKLNIKSKFRLKKRSFSLVIDLYEGERFFCAHVVKIRVKDGQIRFYLPQLTDLTCDLNNKMQAHKDSYDLLISAVFYALQELANKNNVIKDVDFKNDGTITATICHPIDIELTLAVQHLVSVLNTLDTLTPAILARAKVILVDKKLLICKSFIASHEAVESAA